MKRIDLSKEFKNFKGEAMNVGSGVYQGEANEEKMTLKFILLAYLKNAHAMGISNDEHTTAYQAGCKVGAGNGKIDLSNSEWSLIKKIVDKNKVKQPNGSEEIYFGIEVNQQAKELIDNAETLDEKK